MIDLINAQSGAGQNYDEGHQRRTHSRGASSSRHAISDLRLEKGERLFRHRSSNGAAWPPSVFEAIRERTQDPNSNLGF